ncbi:hypothetical protein, conserved [Leishmania tarentolae]|uniref:RRM domain-containing protein n=1 Tax=Leishmania tarentolae TaxID=5689 RepID=A0A640KNU6_LEITA|nr:hypothetical protein, conserved [Leishmania tarentolae]
MDAAHTRFTFWCGDYSPLHGPVTPGSHSVCACAPKLLSGFVNLTVYSPRGCCAVCAPSATFLCDAYDREHAQLHPRTARECCHPSAPPLSLSPVTTSLISFILHYFSLRALCWRCPVLTPHTPHTQTYVDTASFLSRFPFCKALSFALSSSPRRSLPALLHCTHTHTHTHTHTCEGALSFLAPLIPLQPRCSDIPRMMPSDAMSASTSTSTPFVYVNGDRLSLMEDYRLPLYQYFPEGTKLFDPMHVPPREVPLSTSSDETGVTLPKLLPNAQYHAFFKDPRTGSLYATATKYICIYVSHLPFNTTPEMLGRYFETFDMVKEADVFPGQNVNCNGRGWVILQDPSKLLIIPRVLQFYGKQFIYTELSDREPAREKIYHMLSEPLLPPPPPPRAHIISHRMDPPPPPPPLQLQHNPNVPAPRSSIMAERRLPPAALTPIGGGLDYDGPTLPAPRSQQRLQAYTALAPTGSSSSSPSSNNSGRCFAARQRRFQNAGCSNLHHVYHREGR